MRPLSKEGMKVLLGCVAIAAIGSAVISVVQVSTGALVDVFQGSFPQAVRGPWQRALGFFPWPIELALFSGIAFFALSAQRERSQLFRVGAFACVVCVVLSITRWAILILLLLWLFDLALSRSLRGILVGLSFAGFAVALLAGIAFELVQADLPTYLSGAAPRSVYLLMGLRIWSDHPLIGVGFARYGAQWASVLEGSSLMSAYGIGSFNLVNTTDTFLAQILPELGLVGASALVMYYWAAIRGLFSRRRELPELTGYALAVCFAVLGVVISSSVLYSSHTMLYWILIGQGIGSCRSSESSRADDAPFLP